LILPFHSFSQKLQTKAEAMNAIKAALHDTSRVKLYVDNAEVAGGNEFDTTLAWLRKGKKIADLNSALLKEKMDEVSRFLWTRFTRFNSVACDKMSYAYYQKADLNRALLMADSTLILTRSINFKPGMARAYNAMAISQQYRGNIKLALQNYDNAIKIHRELNNQRGIITCLINQAILFNSISEKEKGTEYYEDAILLAHKEGMKEMEGSALANFAGVLVGNGMNEKAIICLEKGMQIATENKDKDLESRLLYTYGVIEYNGDRFDEALIYFNKAKDLQEETRQYISLSNTYNSIANVYFARKDFKKALELTLRAHGMNEEYGIPDKIAHSALSLSDIYEKLGDTKKALLYYKLSVKMKDSVINESNRKVALKNQLQSDFDIKTAADSVAHAKENEIKSAELSRQSAEIKVKKNQQYLSFGGLAIILLFSVFMFNRWKVTQKQKVVIEKQKEEVEKQKSLVEIKQKEVIDSIEYAKRIQLAQMPSEKRLQSLFRQIKRF
jgi:tetratricopeptide (TPR) repeat protein